MEHEPLDGLKMSGRAHASLGPAAIGADSDAIRIQLCAIAEKMHGLLEGPARTLVHDASRVLQAMVCRIAVIGQVKAGKSSLINALIRRPQLLPSDVNPWTTAVTRLHFKQSNQQNDVAAEFRFFDSHEWDELAVGGGRIRELTERLVPGFEATALGRHLRAMRDRAADRLGPEFTELLGQSHTFRTFDHKTLEAYVCAAKASIREPEDTLVGRYSNITKSAHLYMNGSPFGFPTTLVDTPGTNDPMLVRDEITRQSLDSADVYIVVLTARQALSTEDVALLRILRGLRKERIIVFVNRIDELADFDAELDAVESQITQSLRREFTGIDIPIVFGSALWANQAIKSEPGASPAERPASLSAFQKRLGLAGNSHDVRGVLLKCSGVPSLAEVLNSAIQQSHPVQVIRHLATSFSQLSDLHQSATQQALASINGAVGNAQARERTIKDLAAALDRLRTVSTTLERSVVAFETALISLAERELKTLQDALWAVVDEFKQTESQSLIGAADSGNLGPVWQCDTGPLRQRLESEFVERFRLSERAILHAERDILPQLQKVIAGILPGHLSGKGLNFAPTPMHPPSLGALGKIVALDLDAPWWTAWWTTKRITEERSNELQRVIGEEFAPITVDLVRSARERLTGQIHATIRETRALCLGIVEQVLRQNEAHIVRLNGIDAAPAVASTPARTARDVAELSKRQTSWAEIRISLDALRRAGFAVSQPGDPGQ